MNICRKQGKVLLPGAYEHCAVEAAPLLPQLLESSLPLLCRKPGTRTPTDMARAQQSTVPPMLFYLPRLLGLVLLSCNCSTIAAIGRPRSQIPRALHCRGCLSTIVSIANAKAGEKMLFDHLPGLLILAKLSGKCSFQIPTQQSMEGVGMELGTNR